MTIWQTRQPRLLRTNSGALKVETTLKADVKTELTKNNKLGDSYIMDCLLCDQGCE